MPEHVASVAADEKNFKSTLPSSTMGLFRFQREPSPSHRVHIHESDDFYQLLDQIASHITSVKQRKNGSLAIALDGDVLWNPHLGCKNEADIARAAIILRTATYTAALQVLID